MRLEPGKWYLCNTDLVWQADPEILDGFLTLRVRAIKNPSDDYMRFMGATLRRDTLSILHSSRTFRVDIGAHYIRQSDHFIVREIKP